MQAETNKTIDLSSPAALQAPKTTGLFKTSLLLTLAGSISLIAFSAYAANAAAETDNLPQSIKPVISSGPLPSDLPLLKPSSDAPQAPEAKKDPLAWDETMPAQQPAPIAEPVAPETSAAMMDKEVPPAAPEVNAVVEAPKAAAPEAPMATTDANTTLEMRVQAIEESIASLKNKSADLEALQVTVGEMQQKLASMETTQARNSEMAPAPVKKKVKKAPRRKKARSSATKKSSSVSTSPRWILKGAKPGTAWISSPGSNEIRTVNVGQSLPGLGRVTAVVKDSNDHWVVNATNGRID